ncbi:MAG: sulfatase [bacterium]
MKDSVIDFSMTTTPACGFKAVVEIEDGKGGTTDVLTQEVVALAGEATQQSFVALDAIRDQIARVSLRALPNCEVRFDRLQVAVPGTAPEIPEVPAPEHVIFWMIDTLRADHLPIHFDTNVRAPNLKRLADEGASFKLAFVEGNESKTSHASLFSGMLPNKHRVVGKGKLRPELELMPEAMKAAGYKTSAFIANGYVSEPWGFVQGWDQFKNHLRDNYRIDGPSMAKAGLDWAKNNATEKFFLYIGTVDPHVTYREHEEIIGYYDTEPYNGRFKRACYGEDLGKIKGGSIKVDERDKRRIHNLYKNEIEFNDGAFGQLRAGLEEIGVWDKTMVIVTADHGDEFWEHGGVGHGHSIYADQTHVPLLMYYPPLIPAKTVVEAGVDIFDVYPTLMDVVKRDRPKDLQGKSLVPLIHKATGDYPEPAIATQYLLHYTMQMQQWKLYLRRGEYQLYDRINDHSEQNDVASAHPLASRWLLDSMGWMRGHRSDWDKAAFGAASNLAPDFLTKLGKSIVD